MMSETLAERMHRYVKGLDVPFGLERSAKCRPGRWSSQRWLYSVYCQALSRQTLAAGLTELLADLAMPAEVADTFLTPLHADQAEALPHYLHLGVEDRRAKVYWETPLSRDVWPAPDERFVLYRAWKWQPERAVTVSDYVLLPTPRQASRQLETLLADMPMVLVDLIEQLKVSFALAQVPWPPLIVRTEEHGCDGATARNSLNLHLHQARLPLGSIAGCLLSLAREWQSAPRRSLTDYLAAHGNEPLGNLTLGTGVDKRPFITYYHGAARQA